MSAIEQFEAAVTALSDAADALNQATAQVDEVEVERLLPWLAEIRDCLTKVRQCDAGFERFIAQAFETLGHRDPVEFPGVGVVEVRRSRSRRAWDHDAAARDWINAFMAKTGGEVLDPAEVLAEFRKAAQINGWKVGGFKELGLFVDDYCESEPGAPKVVIS